MKPSAILASIRAAQHSRPATVGDTGVGCSGTRRLGRRIVQFLLALCAMLVLASLPSASAAQGTADTVIAAGKAASGGEAWRSYAGLRLRGRFEAGGAPGRFDRIVDLRRGFSRTDLVTGAFRYESGFDGEAWNRQNGILTVANLPMMVADVRADAFLLRRGWAVPASRGQLRVTGSGELDGRVVDIVAAAPEGASAVELWFDRATHHVVRSIVHGDFGPVVTTYSDWRKVGPLTLPFREVQTEATGQVTVLQAERVELLRRMTRRDLQRPPREPRGHLLGAVPPTVPFEFTGFDRGHIVVEARVNGLPARLIFDTGAANYFVPESARRLGLTTAGGVNIGGVGETSQSGGYARVDRMGIGPAVLERQVVMVAPLPYVAVRPRAGIVLDGLAGFEFVSEFRTTLDYGRRTLSFASFDEPPPQEGVTLPFFTDSHSIYVEAEVEGRSGLFRLDTGDSGTLTLFRTFSETHRLFPDAVERVASGGVGGELATRLATARSVVLGGRTFSNVPVEISQSRAGAFASRGLAGNIGSGLLARYRLILDYRSKRVTFIPLENADRPFHRDRSGLSVTQDAPDALRVLDVTPGSPAARAGLARGDRIIGVNGRSVAEAQLGPFDLNPLRAGRRPFTLLLESDGRTRAVVIDPSSEE